MEAEVMWIRRGPRRGARCLLNIPVSRMRVGIVGTGSSDQTYPAITAMFELPQLMRLIGLLGAMERRRLAVKPLVYIPRREKTTELSIVFRLPSPSAEEMSEVLGLFGEGLHAVKPCAEIIVQTASEIPTSSLDLFARERRTRHGEFAVIVAEAKTPAEMLVEADMQPIQSYRLLSVREKAPPDFAQSD